MRSLRIHHLLNSFELFSLTLRTHKRIYLNFDIFPYTVNSFRGPRRSAVHLDPTRFRNPAPHPEDDRTRWPKKNHQKRLDRSIDLRVFTLRESLLFRRLYFPSWTHLPLCCITAKTVSPSLLLLRSDARCGREPLPPQSPQSLFFFRLPQRPVFAVPPSKKHYGVAVVMVPVCIDSVNLAVRG